MYFLVKSQQKANRQDLETVGSRWDLLDAAQATEILLLFLPFTHDDFFKTSAAEGLILSAGRAVRGSGLPVLGTRRGSREH